jgi:heme exporter protein A
MRLTGRDLAAARGGRPVFAGLGFDVAGGEVLAVSGPNGSGKSTLLRIVAGLLMPTAGSVALTPAPDDGIGRMCHYVGHLDGLKPSLSLVANLDFWRRLIDGDAGGAAGIDEALAAVGLSGLGGLPVAVLSAGQKRRAALARLLIIRRPVWLLDEPLTALDAQGQGQLAELIERHCAGGGLVVAATHRELPVGAAATLVLGGAT